VLRKTVITALLFAVFAAPAHAGKVSLMPGVSYERQVQFTPHGPVVVHILRAPRPGGLYSLRPLLSNDSIIGRETVTSMQKRARGSANLAGVNGDLFTFDEGLPSGMLMQSGVLEAPPHPKRSTLGITDDGSLIIDRVTMLGQWQGSGPKRALNGLNQRPGAQGISLFTPAWGDKTPQANGTVEVVLEPMPPAAPFTDLTGTVIDIKTGGGSPIPRDGAVLVARGRAASRLAAESVIGGSMIVRLVLRPQWGAVVDAIGGGPLIVRNGQPVFAALEDFAPSQINPRNPRTAVGQLADGRIVMVAVDGRRSGYSVGVSTFELAQQLVRLGAVTGTALDSGGSTTMAFNGKLLNRPSDPGGERAVSDSLNVFYYGVVIPQAPKPVLSPNGDGVAETQTLTYKLVRPATVTASLIGPDRIPRQTETGLREPGTYRTTWSGRTPAGAAEPEGRWRWVVDALDDQGQHSHVERRFYLNRTLGYLRIRPTRVVVHRRGGKLRVGFRLAHPAVVTVTIRNARGGRVKTIRRRLGSGQRTIRWNGLYGNGVRAFTGFYTASVRAANSFGLTELERHFLVRRARR
jgi:Phosphodiester glycosidase/FlgD Ig-like domain